MVDLTYMLYIDVFLMGKGSPKLTCPFRLLVVLYWMLATFTKYEVINVWDTVSAHIHLPRMFLSTDCL